MIVDATPRRWFVLRKYLRTLQAAGEFNRQDFTDRELIALLADLERDLPTDAELAVKK